MSCSFTTLDFSFYHEVVCWECSLFYLVLFCQYLVKHLTFLQFLHFTQSVKVQIHFSKILLYGFYLFLFSNSIFLYTLNVNYFKVGGKLVQIEQLFSFNNLLFQSNYEKTEPDGRIGRAGAPRS